MSYLKKNTDGRYIMPSFPELRKKINAAQEEIEFINKEVIPELRNIGLVPGSGLNCALILKAAESPSFLPSVPKRTLQYRKYIGFQGRACYFLEKDFMFEYDLTQDGKDRLAAMREFEELPEALQNSCVIER